MKQDGLNKMLHVLGFNWDLNPENLTSESVLLAPQYHVTGVWHPGVPAVHLKVDDVFF